MRDPATLRLDAGEDTCSPGDLGVQSGERPTWMPGAQFFACVLKEPADAELRVELAELQPDLIENL